MMSEGLPAAKRTTVVLRATRGKRLGKEPVWANGDESCEYGVHDATQPDHASRRAECGCGDEASSSDCGYSRR